MLDLFRRTKLLNSDGVRDVIATCQCQTYVKLVEFFWVVHLELGKCTRHKVTILRG
ncbi:hypothetical protein Hanom_Chr05g00400531 [Helianthus anomalus]